MSRVKKTGLPHYELLYLISNKFSENELDPIKTKVLDLIKSNDGTITYTEDWGKRKLAYKIDGFRFGYYQLVEFDMPGVNLLKVETVMRLDKEILRHMVVTKKALTDEERALEKQQAAERAAADEEEVVETKEVEVTTEKTSKPEVETATETTEKATKKTAKKEDKLEFEDLDAKLDQILDTKDLL